MKTATLRIQEINQEFNLLQLPANGSDSVKYKTTVNNKFSIYPKISLNISVHSITILSPYHLWVLFLASGISGSNSVLVNTDLWLKTFIFPS